MSVHRIRNVLARLDGKRGWERGRVLRVGRWEITLMVTRWTGR